MFLPAASPLLDDPSAPFGWLTWIGSGCLLALGIVIWQLRSVTAALRAQARELDRLQRLEAIADSLEAMAEGADQLGRRRLEHVLIDIRDGHRRFEERWLAQSGKQSVQGGGLPVYESPAGSLSERVTNRLLAMGFERIDVLTPIEELQVIGDGSGKVRVEAKRAGVAHKGHVELREGAIADVHLRDSYDAFP